MESSRSHMPAGGQAGPVVAQAGRGARRPPASGGEEPIGGAIMQQEVFDAYRELVYRTCGIYLSEQKQALVTARIGKRMRALGITDYGAYYRHVVNDASGHELSELVNAISTNVTHFFREKRHFDVLARVAGEWARAGHRHLHLWCAACSTGEEPYSIAITLRESLPAAVQLKLDASDISTKVLQAAKFGVYKDQDVAGIPMPLLRRYFQKGGPRAEGLYRVKQELRELVDFRQINLSTPPYPIDGPLDVIFCRNVMIYFNQELRRLLVQTMERMLRPGGYLFVGMAESLSGIHENLVTVEPSVYRKVR